MIIGFTFIDSRKVFGIFFKFQKIANNTCKTIGVLNARMHQTNKNPNKENTLIIDPQKLCLKHKQIDINKQRKSIGNFFVRLFLY
jgi:hypothetical protein